MRISDKGNLYPLSQYVINLPAHLYVLSFTHEFILLYIQTCTNYDISIVLLTMKSVKKTHILFFNCYANRYNNDVQYFNAM